MKGVTTWVLVLLALVSVILGVGEQLALFKSPLPPLGFGVLAAIVLLFQAIRMMPLRLRRPVVFVLVLAALAALTAGLAYFQFVIKPNMVKGFLSAAFAPKPTAVAVEAARIEQWPPQLEAIGTLRAYQGVVIAPQAAGVVTAIHFESGDDVETGALLVNIDDSVEQADLANGVAQLKNAEATLERQKQLVANGNTPQSSVDTALAARDSAAAAVAHSRAIIAQKAIRAPFAGRLGLRNVDIGQYVSVGTNLGTLQRLDPIYVDFPAPEGALSNLAVGQDVTMTIDALPGRQFDGRVKAIDARVNVESRNVLVRAEFANPDHRLLPGMFANVTVTIGSNADVLTAPRTAIVESLYGNNVFVVKAAPPAAKPSPEPPADKGAGLIVERRFVQVGAARGERIAILKGVEPGERVVIAGQIKLQDNAPVEIDDSGALPPPAQTPKP